MGRKTHGPYLIAAIEYNDIEKVSEILAKQFRDRKAVRYLLVSEIPRLTSEHTEIPLLLAASLPDPAILRYFVTKHDVNVNHVFESGNPQHQRKTTALLVAVRHGHYDTVDAIISLNGDVNAADHKGRRPLHHAIRRADYRMTKMLLARGAEVNCADVASNTPLHTATIYGHTELVKLLLLHSADVYRKGQRGAISVHMAAHEGHASLVRLFCQFSEVNPNTKVPCYDHKDKAPLHVAAECGHSETVFTLLEHCGAGVDIRDSEGETPLHCAVINEYDQYGMKSKEDFTETVKLLINYGADVNTRNARGETSLHLAARNEFQKVIEVLVLAGCDPLIEDNDGNRALDLTSEGDTVSVQILRHAISDRDRYMSEALEVRARGFTTLTQNQAALPLAIRSPSLLSMPLLMGAAQGVHNITRTASSPGLFAVPPQSAILPGQFGILADQRSGVLSLNGAVDNQRLSDVSHLSTVLPTGLTPFGHYGRDPRVSTINGSAIVPNRDSVSLSNNGAQSVPVTRSMSVPVSEQSPPPQNAPPRVTSSFAASEDSVWNVTPASSEHFVNGQVANTENTNPNPQRQKRKIWKKKNHSNTAAVTTRNSRSTAQTVAPPVNKLEPDIQSVPSQLTTNEFDDDSYFDDESFDTFVETSFDDLDDVSKPPPIPPRVGRNVSSSSNHDVVHGWLSEQPDPSQQSNFSTTSDAQSRYSDFSTVTASSFSAPNLPPKHSRASSTSSVDTVKRRPAPPLPEKVSASRDGDRKKSKKSGDIVFEVKFDNSDMAGKTVLRLIPVLPTGTPKVRTISNQTAKLVLDRLEDDLFIEELLTDFGGALSTLCGSFRGYDGRTTKDTTAPMSHFRFILPNIRKKKSHKTHHKCWEKISLDSNENNISSQNAKHSVHKSSVHQLKKKNKHVSRSVSSDLTDNVSETSSSQWHRVPGYYHWPMTDDTASEQLSAQSVLTVSARDPVVPPSSKTLIFEKVSLQHDDMADYVASDYLFHRSVAGLTTVSAENITESVDRQLDNQSGHFSQGSPVAESQNDAVSMSPSSVSVMSNPGIIFQPATFTYSNFSPPMTTQTFAQLTASDPHTLQQSSKSLPNGYQREILRPREKGLPSSQQQIQSEELMPVAEPSVSNSVNSSPRHVTSTAAENRSSTSSSDAQSDKRSSAVSSASTAEYQSKRRTISLQSDGKIGLAISGGNVSGTFISSISDNSPAASVGFIPGDWIVGVNGKSVKDFTKQEVVSMIESSVRNSVRITVEQDDERHKFSASRNAAGDCFFVRANFNYTPTTAGSELTVRDQDIFNVGNSIPKGAAGFWFARKVGAAAGDPDGLIPNMQKAEQILTKQKLISPTHSKSRGGAFLRSFRRGKSSGGHEDSDSIHSRQSSDSSDIVPYVRVVELSTSTKRPVVVMGLFCNEVCTVLSKNSPGIFEVPTKSVEYQRSAGEAFDPRMLDVDGIRQIVNTGRHCLLVLSPKAVHYLRDKTELRPIVIYLSPSSKNVLKSVVQQLVPGCDQKVGFMLEEAGKFEAFHTGLFDAIVQYTVDSSWMPTLKQTVGNLQRQPQWIPFEPEDCFIDEGSTADDSPRSGGKSRRISKTTDDIPNPIQDLLMRHINIVSPMISESPAADDLCTQSFDLDLKDPPSSQTRSLSMNEVRNFPNSANGVSESSVAVKPPLVAGSQPGDCVLRRPRTRGRQVRTLTSRVTQL